METLRLAKGLISTRIREPYTQGTEAFGPTAPSHGADWADRKILPPFLGEMGFELRYFLAAVEPWLRSGWCIPAKRPEYYPEGTAFHAPEFFKEINDLMAREAAIPIGMSFVLAGPQVLIAQETTINQNKNVQVTVAPENPDANQMMIDIALMEKRLRDIYVKFFMAKPRPLTPWDYDLLSVFDGRPSHLLGGSVALAPSYKPEAFVNPVYESYPHVGVQIRHMQLNPGRNSDIAFMIETVEKIAAYTGLPILVYGHPNGTYRPEGMPSTAEAAPHDLLRYELSMLSQCKIMLAPESGWADLMCWLQIPTFLEKLGRPHEFTANKAFKPRIMLINADEPISQQVDRLLATKEHVPYRYLDNGVFDDMDWDSPWVRELANYYVRGV